MRNGNRDIDRQAIKTTESLRRSGRGKAWHPSQGMIGGIESLKAQRFSQYDRSGDLLQDDVEQFLGLRPSIMIRVSMVKEAQVVRNGT